MKSVVKIRKICESGGPLISNELQKEVAHSFVDNMPPHSTWDDLIHEIYVRQAIEKGLADSEAGRTHDVMDVRSRFGLSE
jgi:hypothetical protein